MAEFYEEMLKNGQVYQSVTLTKNTKGYSWEIKVAGVNLETVQTRVVELEEFYRNKYGDKT